MENKTQRLLRMPIFLWKAEFKRIYLNLQIQIGKFIWTFWSQYLSAYTHQTPVHTDEPPMRSFVIYPKFQNLQVCKFGSFVALAGEPYCWDLHGKCLLLAQEWSMTRNGTRTVWNHSGKSLYSLRNHLRRRAKISFKNCKVNCRAVLKQRIRSLM